MFATGRERSQNNFAVANAKWWERMIAVKMQFDPGKFFRLNQIVAAHKRA